MSGNDLTPSQVRFMDALRQLEGPSEWLLFINADYTMEDARALYDRGLIDAQVRGGMAAARLKYEPPENAVKAGVLILSLSPEDRLELFEKFCISCGYVRANCKCESTE